MRKPMSYKAWEEWEDYFILKNQGQFTHQQIAEQLDRPRESIRYRVQYLRKRGVQIATLKAGRPKGGQFMPTPDPLPLTTEPGFDSRTDRETLAEECQRYLQRQISQGQLDLKRATAIAARIKQDVLLAPELNFQRMAQLRVDDIVRHCS